LHGRKRTQSAQKKLESAMGMNREIYHRSTIVLRSLAANFGFRIFPAPIRQPFALASAHPVHPNGMKINQPSIAAQRLCWVTIPPSRSTPKALHHGQVLPLDE
jgi:hypothetical protein